MKRGLFLKIYFRCLIELFLLVCHAFFLFVTVFQIGAPEVPEAPFQPTI